MPVYPTNRSCRQPATRGLIGVTGVAASVATFMAMLAMTAVVSGAPIASGTELDRTERSIRAVAAAVAAAARDLARDLIKGERSATAVTFVDPVPAIERPGVTTSRLVAAAMPRPTPPAEHLLDLPPPGR